MSSRLFRRAMPLTVSSLVLLAGAASTQADGGRCGGAGSGGVGEGARPREVRAENGRACRRAMDKARSDMNRLLPRACGGLRSAVHDEFEALHDLADAGGATPDDLDALGAQMRSDLDAAVAKADAAIDARGDKLLSLLTEKGAGEALIQRAKQLIERQHQRVHDRADDLSARFQELMDELFPPDPPDVPDDGDDGGDDSAGGDDPPPPPQPLPPIEAPPPA